MVVSGLPGSCVEHQKPVLRKLLPVPTGWVNDMITNLEYVLRHAVNKWNSVHIHASIYSIHAILKSISKITP